MPTRSVIPLYLALTALASSAQAAPQTRNPANGHYYEYISLTVTWGQARSAAESYWFNGVQGHLATISDAAENAFVRSVDQGQLGGWIGGFQDTSAPGYSEPGGGWTWVTGEPVTYTNWRSYEPSNTAGNENFIEMVDDGSWNDVGSGASMFNAGFVIEYDTARVNPANGHHYEYVASTVSWTQARAAAAASFLNGVQGHLATISDAAENAFVRSVDQGPLGGWIGGFQNTSASGYSEPGGGWTWVTGEPITYTNWRAGEPNNGGGSENYLEMVDNGTWNDVGNTVGIFNEGYVIEYDTPFFNPMNGHSYMVIDANLCWDAARAAADSMFHGGVQGHLATITSAAERAFVYSIMPAGLNRWLGGFQDTMAPNYSEPAGGWKWVTGESFAYTDWAAGEPNNGFGLGEGYIELFAAPSPPGWNDSQLCTQFSDGYIVEFDDNLGQTYCTGFANSTGATGTLSVIGSRFVADNNITLLARQLPLSALAYFVTSRNPGPGTTPPNSVGNLCLGGPNGRYVGPGQLRFTGATGTAQLRIDLSITPTPTGLVQVLAGETWHFQCWHRDSVAGSATSNLTSAVRLRFQ